MGRLEVVARLGLGHFLVQAVFATTPDPVAVETLVWTSVGPYGAFVNTIAVDPRDPSFLVVGTRGGFREGERERWAS